MKFKKIMFISFILLILSLTAVSAADLNDTYITESSDGDVSLDSIQIQSSDNIGDSPGTFTDLQNEVNNAPAKSVLILTRDYNGAADSKINLNKDLTIDGQDHTIDFLGKEDCFAFYSKSGTITLKNLIIKNGNNRDTDKGGAICCVDSARYIIDNCTFINNFAFT